MILIGTPKTKRKNMASRRVGQKVVDWAKISSTVPKEVRAEFNQFRGTYEKTLARVNAYPETPQPIEWDQYKKNISLPGFVEEFQKQYEALKIPYPADTSGDKLADFQKEIESQAKEAISQSKLKAAELQKELDKIKAEKPFEEMTIDEYLANKPEIREEAMRDAYNHKWHSFKS